MIEKEKLMRTNRRPYSKPEIEQVQLIPEEAVLTSCKTSTGGPGRPGVGCAVAPKHCKNTLGS